MFLNGESNRHLTKNCMQTRIKFCLFASFALTLTCSFLFGQEVTKSTHSPIAGTVCPNMSTYYEVSRPNGFGACKVTWSIINGKITSGNGLSTVTVEWNDSPGMKGKLTATFSECGSVNSDNNGKTASLEELILSVKGKSFGTYTNYVNVDYCTRASVYLQVPPMVVDGTGGIKSCARCAEGRVGRETQNDCCP